MKRYPSQLAERFQIRMPEGLRGALKEQAKRNKRTLNAEIVFHLEGAVTHTSENEKSDVTA